MSLVLQAIDRHARATGEALAVGDGEAGLSFSALAEAIAGLADLLDASCSGDQPVAFSLDNSPAWAVVDLALVRLGRAALPLPGFFTDAQRGHALSQAGAGWLVEDRPPADAATASLALAGTRLHLSRLDNAPVALPAGTAKITFTSGTTAAPRGVCLAQNGLDAVAASLVETIGSDYAGRHLAVLPLGVLLENVAGLYPCLIAGGACLLPAQVAIGFTNPFRPDMAALVRALAGTAATSAILVPEMLKGIVHVLATTGVRLPALRFVAVGGAAVAEDLLAAAEAVGLPVYQGYGLSEAGSVLCLNTPGANRPGSVGKPLPHVRLSVDGGGEVHFGPPTFLGLAGATRPPQASFATGDLGHLDADGYLHIRGRKANTLITGFGRNVSPEWVESALLARPEIAQAMVFGEAAPALAALVVPASGATAGEAIDQGIEVANATLPDYARVRSWSLVSPFTSGNGQATANGRPRRANIARAHAIIMDQTIRQVGRHTPFFQRLVAETRTEQGYLLETPQIRDGLAGRISLTTYLDYLAEAYHHVRHTVPLMALAKAGLPAGREWLNAVLDEYIAEEEGHEAWILDDIANAGGDAEAVRKGAPRAATEFMVAYAYDTVTRVNPVGFFGMVLVLEGTSTQLATVGAKALMASLHLPETCFHYLLSHGALDIEHMCFFEEVMNRIEAPEDQAAIIHMAKRMYVLFANMFRAIPHEGGARHAA